MRWADVPGARRVAQHALEAVVYYHRYDTQLLSGVITAAYVGWMLLLLTYLLRSFPLSPVPGLPHMHSRAPLIRCGCR